MRSLEFREAVQFKRIQAYKIITNLCRILNSNMIERTSQDAAVTYENFPLLQRRVSSSSSYRRKVVSNMDAQKVLRSQ